MRFMEACAGRPVVGVGLQSFCWADLRERKELFGWLANRAEEFADAGFSHVWLPPASQGLDWQGYIPNQWYKIVGEQSFRALNRRLVQRGVAPVCEVIVNHRAAENVTSCNGEFSAFSNPTWDTTAVVSFDWKCESNCTAYCYGPCKCGNPDTGQNLHAAPDIDHTNPIVKSDIKAFMKWMMKEYLCKGWRFDMVKGYDAAFAKEYWQSTGVDFAIGEYFDGITDRIVNWTNSSGMLAFDIPHRDALKTALETENYTLLGTQGGKPPGVAGQNMFVASTYIDHHDSTHVGGPVFDGGFSAENITLGYVYILTHPPFPWVFRPHYDGIHRDAIKTLIAIRNNVRISAKDSLFISASAVDLYAAYVGAADPCQGKLAVRLGQETWRPCGDGWVLAARDVGWAVWMHD